MRAPAIILLEGAVERDCVIPSLLLLDFAVVLVLLFFTPMVPFLTALLEADIKDELEAVEAEELGRAG